MMNIGKKEVIAVSAGLVVIVYLFFSGPLIQMFNLSDNTSDNPQQVDVPDTGVDVEEVALGSGSVARAGDLITAHYVGYLTNGRVFDSSYDRNAPITFTLGVGQVIKGWDEGLLGMRVGGKRILKIAPDYGYGAQSAGAIPSNSHLIFEVELVNVQKSQ